MIARRHPHFMIEGDKFATKYVYLLRQQRSSFHQHLQLVSLYYCVLGATKAVIDTYPESLHLNIISVNYSMPYALLVLFTISYPLSGFTADICCGRYKTIYAVSFSYLCSFSFLCTAAEVLAGSKLPIKTVNELFHNPLGILWTYFM